MNKITLIKIIILSFLTSITLSYLIIPFIYCKQLYKKINIKNLRKIYVILFDRKIL